MPLLYATFGGLFATILMLQQVEHYKWLAKFNCDRADFWRRLGESEPRK